MIIITPDIFFYFVPPSSRNQQRIWKLKSAYPLVEILAGPAASVREAKRLIQAGADGIVAGTGCDVGGDPAAPQAVALGRGEATMVYEVRADLHGTRTWKSCFFGRIGTNCGNMMGKW